MVEKTEAKWGGPADDDKSSGRVTESTNGRVAPPAGNGRADQQQDTDDE